MKLTERTLKAQLSTVIPQPIRISRIDRMKNDRSSDGSIIHERDRLKNTFERRLEGSLLHDPNGEARTVCEEILRGLNKVTDEETMFSWSVETKEKKRIDGYSTEERFVYSFPETWSNK